MLRVAVEGGTGAGSRIVKQPKTWTHWCASRRRATRDEMRTLGGLFVVGESIVARTLHSYSCPDCGARRPA